MTQYNINSLKDLKLLLNQLNNDQYCKEIAVLNNASIGQHIRHIIEYYQCLFASELDVINYDSRKRNLDIEKQPNIAIACIDDVVSRLTKVNGDRDLQLHVNYSHEDENKHARIKSTMYRELAYNLEHTIHHQALIKVAIHQLSLSNLLDESFGLAPSTIRHKKSCVQ